ncbi:MAG: NAD-dependent epimerase/dehydratase family protein [Bdellovibrionales bacterium]|nr:NAD-dependent epimerase/dehydratase family protein [Bdellovibrionales bacterium]
MAKVLVTGGAGFIGSHIVDQMLALEHEVAVLDDLSSGTRSNLSKDVLLKVLDIRTQEAREFVRDFSPEILIHAAAQISVRVSMENPTLDTEINLVGLVNILQAFPSDRLPYIVFISTGGALYGEQDFFPATEDHPIRPASVYGLAKYTSERYLQLWSEQFGLQYVALRLGNVYGPRQNPHGEAGVVAIFCRKFLKGETPKINGSGTQTRDFVFVGDVARAVVAAINSNVKGSFNIGTSKETNILEIYRGLADAYGFTGSPNFGPGMPGEQMRSCIDSTKAKSIFDWSPQVEIRDGLAQTMDWFSKNQDA